MNGGALNIQHNSSNSNFKRKQTSESITLETDKTAAFRFKDAKNV